MGTQLLLRAQPLLLLSPTRRVSRFTHFAGFSSLQVVCFFYYCCTRFAGWGWVQCNVHRPCWCFQQQASIDKQIRCNALVVVITNKTRIKFHPLPGLQFVASRLFYLLLLYPLRGLGWVQRNMVS
jgi:hypothetical protein